MKTLNNITELIEEIKEKENSIYYILEKNDEFKNLEDELYSFNENGYNMNDVLNLDIYVILDEEKEEISKIGFKEEGIIIKVESLRRIEDIYFDLVNY